jgi:hypothetical protein
LPKARQGDAASEANIGVIGYYSASSTTTYEVERPHDRTESRNVTAG